jgi:hypothetical protein
MTISYKSTVITWDLKLNKKVGVVEYSTYFDELPKGGQAIAETCSKELGY